jgi:ethanolamine permease
MSEETKKTVSLKRTLGSFRLWGIAVGLVISGEYFGWSYGWAHAGTLGFLIAGAFVALMYVTFMFSFTELSTSIPQAGGPFAYARRAFGDTGGFVAGFATLVEFVFAPPAIAMAIGDYLGGLFGWIHPQTTAVVMYFIFMGLNLLGVGIAATFELAVTILAVVVLLVFMGVVAPGFEWANFAAYGWAGSDQFGSATFAGIFASIPFAIWFFLAIEGAAMSAEEAKDPKRTIPKAFIFGIITLLALAIGVMIFAGGVGDWRELANVNDPLPRAMKIVTGETSIWVQLLVLLGVFGLIASFHGIIMGYSRQIYAQARAGYLPRTLAAVNPKFRTPHWAILAGGVVGILAIFSDQWVVFGEQPLTANIVTVAVFGSITMYVVSMLALIRLRKKEPDLERPYRAPFYPVFPLVSLVLAAICLVVLIFYNRALFLVFLGMMALGYIYFLFSGKKVASEEIAEEIASNVDE